jgi:hypothetical protein
MSPWIVGKPTAFVSEKPPHCIHLKAVSEHDRQCSHPKFLDKIAGLGEIPKGPPKCLFTDEHLRDCAWYDSGLDPNDKRSIKKKEPTP